MRKLRWGIAGGAAIAARSVIPAILSSETGQVTAIASRNEAKAKEMAKRYGIPKSYGSYELLLSDPEIDAVYIPLPNHLHLEWTIRAAESGKHVLCEKPIALDAEQSERMVDACKKAGVLLAEAFMYRHDPRYGRIHKLIQSGEIGELRALHATFTFHDPGDKNNIRFRRESGGGSLYDLGCYPISAARMIFGSEPEAATIQAQLSPHHDQVDMMVSGMLEFPGSAGLTFQCGMWTMFQDRLEILGSHGRIEVPDAFLGAAGFFVATPEGRREENIPAVNTYSLEFDDMALAVWGQRDQRFAPEDSIRNMLVMDACQKSARERIRVPL